MIWFWFECLHNHLNNLMSSLQRVKDIYLRDGFSIFVGHFAILRLHPWAQEDFSGQLFIFLTQIIIRENPWEY